MYVITAATGNTGKEIAEALLQAGKSVTVIGREAEKLQALVDLGAQPAVGNLEDTEFLTQTFRGATAVYAVIPPKWDVTNFRHYQNTMGKSLTEAIRKAGVPNVVVLSSNGAQLPDGTGVVGGLYDFEQSLKRVENLNILALRAGYFMQNLFGLTGMIQHLGFFGYSLRNDVKLPLVHTRDIAQVAVRHLLALDFEGFAPVFVAGAADLSMDEVAGILAQAIGKPDLKYVPFSYADAKAGMLQNGLPETIADGYNELFQALNEGRYLNDYQRTKENTTPTTLEWFAGNEFAPAFQHQTA